MFSCAGQDQPLDWIGFPGLRARLRQNSVPEKLTRRWIEFAAREPAAEIGGFGADYDIIHLSAPCSTRVLLLTILRAAAFRLQSFGP